MNYIAKVTVKIDGQEMPATVTENGTVVLPSGEEKEMTPEMLQMVKEKLEEEAAKRDAGGEPVNEPEATAPAEKAANEAAEQPAEGENAVENTDPAEEKADEQVSEEKKEDSQEPSEKIPVSELGKHKEPKEKKKGGASFILAIVFGILLAAETIAVGVGYSMGYVKVELPGTSNQQSVPEYIDVPATLPDSAPVGNAG